MKSKKFIKILACVIAAVILMLSVGIVILRLNFYEDGEEDGLLFGYNTLTKKAFCYGTKNEEDASEFTIPDTFMEYPVTELGGYITLDTPASFFIGAPIEEDACLTRNVDVKPWDEHYQKRFTVHIGKNLKKLSYISDCFYAVKGYGEEQDVLFKVVYSFTVDPENQTFYAEDGKLYERKSGRLVEEFFYD